MEGGHALSETPTKKTKASKRTRSRNRPSEPTSGPSRRSESPAIDEMTIREIGIGADKRLWVEHVQPEIDGGKWPAKGIQGDRFIVEADLVVDGHDTVAGVLLYRHGKSPDWNEVPLKHLQNDRFRAGFNPAEIGFWEYTIEAWIDEFATWQNQLRKRVTANQNVDVELMIGAELVARSARLAEGEARRELQSIAGILGEERPKTDTDIGLALGDRLAELMAAHPDRSRATRYDRVLEARIERIKARFSTWYELFPRSTGKGTEHGTFRDVESVLPYIASMGFDVLYLPPIHPIGTTHRKGKNNSLSPEPGDPGSPWAIGSEQGGHKSIHPELGNLEDFRRLISKAEEHGIEIALDMAFQTSPDHPYVREHPQWFRQRPDGTIQYSENPPKKYQDIYPLDFGSEDWQGLWRELYGVFRFWIEQGVRIFRVDNPHTKPLAFWAWCIRALQEEYPDVLFLSEAFTRPKLLHALAKAGFSQSYTYFTWRNTSWELREYMEELTKTDRRFFLRPNFWTNTPDILPEHLQFGGRAAFVARSVLAATLTSNYGLYGPAFELMEHVARPGTEEYIDNEKYEIRDWNLEHPDSLRPILTRLNRARRENPALQSNDNLRFHATDNEQLLCYSKHTDDLRNRVLVVVNLDFHHTQSGWLDLDFAALGLESYDSFQVHDLLSDARYFWTRSRNYVELNPHAIPAHVFVIRHFMRREQDFEYYA